MDLTIGRDPERAIWKEIGLEVEQTVKVVETAKAEGSGHVAVV